MNEGAGDWICSDQSCGNINFARRLSCYRCNKDKPDGGKVSKKKLGTEIGKSAAEKSRGLFNADDWQCNKCANVNWARRTTCNVCNAPKFGEVEARTGYGGGYNERGGVEYRRREPSSDDEYDEFGRKRRRRRADTPDGVGINEGPLVKTLPPTLLQMKINMDAKEDPAPNNNGFDAIKSTLSEGSVCDLPPLSKMAFRRHQLEQQTDHHRLDQMLPAQKTNGVYSLKKINYSDQDLRVPKVFESTPIIPSRAFGKPTVSKCSNQNRENITIPSKDDFVYKFTGATPSESYEVSYSIEERVKVAAFAIVHNNCKISTEKFEAMYDKPAPDFKTIFAWRRRLLTTGCLIDTHISSTSPNNIKISPTKAQFCPKPQPSPDEIRVSSGSEVGCSETKKVHSNSHTTPLPRSISAETLVLCNKQNNKASTTIGNVEDQAFHAKEGRLSPLQRVKSSSCDSLASNYPNSDTEKRATHISKFRIKSTCRPVRNKQLNKNQDSETEVSYDSDSVDFLSRAYGEERKSMSRRKKREVRTGARLNSETNGINRYYTVNKSDQSSLANANFITSNVQNVQLKNNAVIDADNCLAEYIPSNLGFTTIKNYQDFKNRFKQKGFWVKGSSRKNEKHQQTSLHKQTNDVADPKVKSPLSMNKAQSIPLLGDSVKEPFIFTCERDKQAEVNLQGDDFTNDDFEQITLAQNYIPFDKPHLKPQETVTTPDTSLSIFGMVQSDSAKKNKSIMEIFDVFDDNVSSEKIPLEDNATGKSFSVVWDEDDDALYKDSNDADIPNQNQVNNTSPANNMLISANGFSETEQSQFSSPNKSFNDVNMDIDLYSARNPQEARSGVEPATNFVDLLKCPKQLEDTKRVLNQVLQERYSKYEKLYMNPMRNDTITQIEAESPKKKLDIENGPHMVCDSKKIHVVESVTFSPNFNIQEAFSNPMKPVTNNTVANNVSMLQNLPIVNQNSQQTVQPDLANILAGINTDTLLLALKNSQQVAPQLNDSNQLSDQTGQTNSKDVASKPVETINLTNDEDWEKESDQEGSIEKQLKKIHGTTGDTPLLSDIFDPGPVILPANVAKKFNISLEENVPKSTDTSENAPLIGNFKSFALPKPILLNRLKLAIKQTGKNTKQTVDAKKRRRKKKNKTSPLKEGKAQEGDDGDEEESGDDADLSKYDLWGSDEEHGQSSKTETTEKAKVAEVKESVPDDPEQNGQEAAPENKTTPKRRSTSSSSTSSTSTSSSSSDSSEDAPKNKFDDFNLNSERESPAGSPRAARSRSPHSRSPHSRSPHSRATHRRRGSRSANEARGHEASRDKERSRDRDRRDRRKSRDHPRVRSDRKERRYSQTHLGARGRHR